MQLVLNVAVFGRIIIALFICWLLSLFISASAQCPTKGDDTKASVINADLLKNRMCYVAKENAVGRNFSDLIQDKIQDTSLIYVDAYITSAKISGTESCECHDTAKAMLDYHIYISATQGDKLGKHNQIVEVSRYSRLFNKTLTFAYVKSLIGHKVRIYGYIFMDEEHKSAIGDWRAGIEEIHPVFFIEKLN